MTPKIKPPPALGKLLKILNASFSSQDLVHEKIKKEKAKEKKKDKEKEEKTGLRRFKSLFVASNFVALLFRELICIFKDLLLNW